MTHSADPCAQVGLLVPQVLLPKAGTDLHAWAVVACDQYTSEPEYWQQVQSLVGQRPSTLNLILPEVYLESPDKPERIRKINQSMRDYLAQGLLEPQAPGFVLVERQTGGHTRTGLVVALDLDSYDYRPEQTPLVRATEGTIVDRLPPRMQIRRDAAVELPHIMVLIDDPERTVIEPLSQEPTALGPTLYDFDLMQGGGHIRGRLVPEGAATARIAGALSRLATLANMQTRYGRSDRGVFLYAMGDGNHSLATAKATWEELKASLQGKLSAAELAVHPARHALVELVNVHDTGLLFEPIHRVVFDVKADHLLESMQKYFATKGAEFSKRAAAADVDQQIQSGQRGSDAQNIGVCVGNQFFEIALAKAPHTLAVGSLQGFLDGYLREHAGSIDYIHGSDAVVKLAQKPDAIGFFLPTIPKHDLFKTVLVDGPLPRKAFSMGEAHEKRFYVEARRIVPQT
ncbi:MAG TPA: DUF1015 domain-containing protein [Polyangiaceae bacterium]|jgi:hypothetical protein|nr:DUF1015 domain-containing protein [Polyangiaceae bacterium]